MLELGIGDEVSISKRGDVIPAVDEVLEKSERIPPSSGCPSAARSAASPLVKEGAASFLPQRGLPRAAAAGAQSTSAPGSRWTSRPWARKPSPSCSPRAGCAPSPTSTRFDYGRLDGEEGFKEKKIARIRASVEKSKSQPFVRVLAALGFEGLAAAVAAALIAHGFDDIDKIIAAAARGDWEAFAAVEGIGEATARQLVGHFSSPANLDLIARLQASRAEVRRRRLSAARLDDSFAGQVWVITGSFEKFNPRSLAADEIRGAAARSRTTSPPAPPICWPAPIPAPSWPRRRSSASKHILRRILGIAGASRMLDPVGSDDSRRADFLAAQGVRPGAGDLHLRELADRGREAKLTTR